LLLAEVVFVLIFVAGNTQSVDFEAIGLAVIELEMPDELILLVLFFL